MDADSTPKVALITGGSSGIGLATADRLAAGGFQIAICGRDPVKLDRAKQIVEQSGQSCSVFGFDLDKSAMEAGSLVDRTVEACGRLDVLINNAAYGVLRPFEDLTWEHFESTINVNLRAVFALTQSAWRQMKSQHQLAQAGRSTIVNISSLAAIDPFPGLNIYGASKAWMDLMTKTLAAEGRPFGIDVYSIRAGAVETPLLRSVFPDFPTDQVLPPEAIADKVWELCQPGIRGESGQVITVARQNAL